MNWSKLGLYSKYPRKKRKKKKKLKDLRLQKYAAKLNARLPKSEVWFQSLFEQHKSNHKLTLYKDKYNHIVGKYIGDVVNEGYKYIIEVDGSIHQDEVVKWKDGIKQKYLTKRGYNVIRVEAYNVTSFDNALKIILDIRSKHVNNYNK